MNDHSLTSMIRVLEPMLMLVLGSIEAASNIQDSNHTNYLLFAQSSTVLHTST